MRLYLRLLVAAVVAYGLVGVVGLVLAQHWHLLAAGGILFVRMLAVR